MITITRAAIWEECSTCQGSGKRFNRKTEEYDKDCRWCDGKGEQPTELGIAVVELMKTPGD